jgi:Flp pilus assembly protein CpaB
LKRSNRLILLIGVFLAVVAFVLIVLLLGGSPGSRTTGATPPPDLPTVVATQDIALGATVTAEMVTVETLPTTSRLAGAFQDPSQVIGKVTRQPVTSGAQITNATFAEGSANNLVVPPGLRAMSVLVDSVSGVGTVIKTGDHVDMVVGLTGSNFPVVEINPDDNSVQVVSGLNSTSVKLLLEGLQVLGTIRQPVSSSGSQATPAPSATPSGPALSQDSQLLVILGVTAQQAEVIKFAQMDATTSLVLRSSQDFFDENGEPVVPAPAGTTGVILKTLVDGGYGVLRPELVEAILPAQQPAP